jgi:succinoglycan biosynthesis transport protein ExoP
MLALGIGFLVEYLDDTIKSPDDVNQALGLETLGIIGRRDNGGGELVITERPRSPVAEAYRALRTNVRFSSLDSPLRTLLVTSPGVTEGKSVTVANLATAMAQAGLKVVAVDGDLRRPRQHKLFALERSEGLTQSLLDGRVDGHLCAAEQVEGLSVLPSGELPPNPADLLGSQRMQGLLDDLAAQADVVIIDSPPLLPVTDAAVLAQHVDGVLLVVEAGRTRRGAAQHAVESLRQVNANVLGVVLNAVPRRRGGGYSYYYYYDQYYADDGGRRKRRRRKKGLGGAVRRRGGSSRDGTADGD